VGNGHARVAKALLDAGADLFLSPAGFSGAKKLPAISAAAEAGHTGVVRALLDAGADANALNPFNGNGFTPLAHAVTCGNADLVDLLIARGADLSWRMPVGGASLLYLAAVKGCCRTIGALLDGGMHVDVERVDGSATPLWVAAESGKPAAVQLLLDRGANLAKSKSGMQQGHTSLHVASQEGHAEVVRILLAHGADACAETAMMRTTPLHAACLGPPSKGMNMRERLDVIKQLVAAGANVNAVDNTRATPLSDCLAGAQLPFGKDPQDIAQIERLMRSFGAR
jgi:ankyrin repeat protein